jgi:hypothetical protein
MPPNTVYVGRPTKWGNPFKIGSDGTREQCISKYRRWIISQQLDLHELQGKNLACFCPLNLACHADVLLELTK